MVLQTGRHILPGYIGKRRKACAPLDGVGFAILVYLIYTNMFGVGRNMIETGKLPGWLGVSWVHATMFVLALAALAWQAGGGMRLRRRRAVAP